jgi:protein-S-isoprenylcysteine O-methyltransferase Ste14
MAQVTFTMPIDLPKAATPEIPVPKKFEFSWDVFFTILLLMAVIVGSIWWWQFSKKNVPTNPEQCKPDGALSTGTYGSDCCSTNGTDSNGNCRSKSPMGIPPYGMTNSATPDYTTNAQYTPALIATPPVPYVAL